MDCLERVISAHHLPKVRLLTYYIQLVETEVTEVIEDIALTRAIKESESTEPVSSRVEVFQILEGVLCRYFP